MDSTPVQNTPQAAPQSTSPKGGPLSLGILYRGTWDLFRANMKKLVMLQLVFSVLSAVVGLIAAGVGLAGTFAVFGGITLTHSGAAPLVGVGVLTVLISIAVGLFLSAWQQVTLLMAVSGEQGTMQELLKKAAHKAPAAIWVLFLAGLIVSIGFVLLFLPGVYAAVVLAFTLPVLVLEGVKGGDALRKSRDYVRGHWAEVFIAGIIFAILYGAAYGIITGIFGAAGSTMRSLVQWALTLVSAPLGTCFLFVLYKALKTVKQ